MCSSYHAIHKVLHSLDAMVIVQALEAFLGARREWLLSALQMSTASGMDSADAASTRLAVIAAQVQVCSLCTTLLKSCCGLHRTLRVCWQRWALWHCQVLAPIYAQSPVMPQIAASLRRPCIQLASTCCHTMLLRRHRLDVELVSIDRCRLSAVSLQVQCSCRASTFSWLHECKGHSNILLQTHSAPILSCTLAAPVHLLSGLWLCRKQCALQASSSWLPTKASSAKRCCLPEPGTGA